MTDKFGAEIQKRLARMRSESPVESRWPAGCTGSLCSWLMFVGPSPGGGNRDSPTTPRGCSADVFWNQDCLDPIQNWSRGFKNSMRHLIEIITGISVVDGAARVYGVLNFDWIQNPDASCVPQERINQGEDAVISILEQTRPRIIVPMERRTFDQLQRALVKRRYRIRYPELTRVNIKANAKAKHKDLSAFAVVDGKLEGSVVIRSPQHPARIFNEEYAKRCARAIRSALEQLADGKTVVELNE
jgi:hypothetical protein